MENSAIVFEELVKRAQPEFGQSETLTPVGEDRPSSVFLTGIHWDPTRSTYVFGDEVEATSSRVFRALPRHPTDSSLDKVYLREEFSFHAARLKECGFGPGASVIWIQLPSGFRSVFTAKIQKCGASGNADSFPAYDDPGSHPNRIKENPLRLKTDPNEFRARQSDLGAILDIHSAEHDIYLSDTKALRASFAANEAACCFFPHRIQPRWRGIRSPSNDGSGPRTRFGIVQDLTHATKLIHAEMADFVEQRREALINERSFKARGGNIVRLAHGLQDYLDGVVEISIMQALGGLRGDPDDPIKNEPVSNFAKWYADEHLLSLNKNLKKTKSLEAQNPDPSFAYREDLSLEETIQKKQMMHQRLERIDEMIASHQAGSLYSLDELKAVRKHVEYELSSLSY